MHTNNRLVRLLLEYALENEIYSVIGLDGKSVKIGVVHNYRLVNARYRFFPIDDAYQYGAVLGEVHIDQRGELAEKILLSEPIVGLTERILDDKFIVLGGRYNLEQLPDEYVKNCYNEDVVRVKAYIETHGYLWE